MSNVFGKNIESYTHLNKLKDKGRLDAHMQAAKINKQPFLFDGELGKYKNKSLTDNEAAAGFGWLTNNLQAIKTEITEVMYLEYRLPQYIPINTNIPEGADSYAYRTRNNYGESGFIDTYGTNAGSAGVSYDILSAPILQGGIDGKWSIQEIRAAMFAGVPLADDTINAATIACLNHIEKVGLVGDPSRKGFETGFINNPDVPKVDAAKKLDDATIDAAQVINGYLNQLIEQTNTIFAQRMVRGLTIYLPVKQFNYLATTKYSTTADKSLLEYIKQYNAWTANTGMQVVFKTLLELKKGATNGTDDRMIIAFNDPKIMEMAQPIQPRVIGIENKLRYYHAPLEYSLGALNFKLPGACLYVDKV